MAQSRKSPAERYIDNVIRSKVTACRWVRLFCERHKRDLKTGRKRGLYFDRDAAQHAIDFYQFLRHSKGKWAARPSTWSRGSRRSCGCCLAGSGARRRRRFRSGYVEIARKNGKTTMASGLALYMMLADGEAGAEVYSAATKARPGQAGMG